VSLRNKKERKEGEKKKVQKLKLWGYLNAFPIFLVKPGNTAYNIELTLILA
jgi:hypothetical protein